MASSVPLSGPRGPLVDKTDDVETIELPDTKPPKTLPPLDPVDPVEAILSPPGPPTRKTSKAPPRLHRELTQTDIVRQANFRVDLLADAVQARHYVNQKKHLDAKIEKLRQVRDRRLAQDTSGGLRETIEAEFKNSSSRAINAAAQANAQASMRVPAHMGLYIPDNISQRLANGTNENSGENLANRTENILKPYKWYEIDEVIIPTEDYNVVKKANLAELWILRLGFVILIVAVIVCTVLFAIYYSKKSETPEYETTKQHVVNGVKFGLTLLIGALMYACNRTTSARDGILTNHLKTAVDVVRRVEKERWCNLYAPLALPLVPKESTEMWARDIPSTA